VGQGLRLTLTGIAAGAIIGLLVTRVLSSVLYGISATDPVAFVTVGISLMVVALVACYVPARWAAKVDPMRALRTQ